MNTAAEDPLFFFRVLSIIAFFVIFFGGLYKMRSFMAATSVDPTMPSEMSSSRTYNKLQIVLIWAHGLLLTGMLSLLLH